MKELELFSDVQQNAVFNYTALDTDTRTFVQEQEAELDGVLKRTSQEIGIILLRVKQRLPHGHYMPWLASRGLSESTAWRCMQVAQGKEIKKSFIMKDLRDPIAAPDASPEMLEPEPAVQGHFMQIMSSSESPEWYTPPHVIDTVLRLVGEIDLDPCSNSHDVPAVPAKHHYTEEDNGLSQQWHGKVYMNPPYGSEIPQWVEKLLSEYRSGRVEEAIALVPGRIDTNWFLPLYEYPMCYIKGRLRFVGAPHSAPFPSVAVYLGNRIDAFIEAFKELGPIMGRTDIELVEMEGNNMNIRCSFCGEPLDNGQPVNYEQGGHHQQCIDEYNQMQDERIAELRMRSQTGDDPRAHVEGLIQDNNPDALRDANLQIRKHGSYGLTNVKVGFDAYPVYESGHSLPVRQPRIDIRGKEIDGYGGQIILDVDGALNLLAWLQDKQGILEDLAKDFVHGEELCAGPESEPPLLWYEK